ncbi:ABC transporter ATP-binding protein [Actibacterium mucosum KCTC 23349]|uniref:ABC transporter ATP-binding protein n=1 Tax=Actibacterium mucosum KCTC 23349 TaxID=1454373 RepID=A0A037ZEV8_9RHOB|nr:ABC transporter ATP-binding protein [Actibacterium mucosum]KAJ54148.1 ABC transporter ATP-binding protein [Actibacterium mucosum KCTC 23349]
MAEHRGILRWIWRGYLRRYWPMIAVALALMSAEGVALGVFSRMIEPMVDNALVAREPGALSRVATVIAGIFVLRAIAGFGHRVLMARVGQRVANHLQKDLLDHMLTLDKQWFQRNPPGGLIERVRGDTTVVSTIWGTILAAGGRDIVALVALFSVAISIDLTWTLIAVAAVPLLVLPVAVLQRLVRRMTLGARNAAEGITTRLDEIFHGITTIKLDRMETRESGRFVSKLDAYFKAHIAAQTGQAAIPALIDVVAGIGVTGVIVLGGSEVLSGDKTPGQFISFLFAIALVFDPLRRLGQISGAWQAALASLMRLHAVFQTQPSILPPAEPRALPVSGNQADVELRDVHMAYDDTPVLNGLNLTAKAGEVTALVGPSGAGKSTVFNLITRLVEPQSGDVRVGGIAVSEQDPDALRALFSVVSQDAVLFDETLRDNILLGRSVPDATLQSVLKAAHVDEFLPKLPNGLDSPCGPRGSALSGGQKQRVAIARALLRDAPILLLDEATSALDTRSERIVQEALEQLSANRTTLVIAHRLATVRNADKIVVMDKGTVAEEGSHDALLASGGLYSGLYQLQFAGKNGA